MSGVGDHRRDDWTVAITRAITRWMRKRPDPRGRVLIRMPRSLHAELVALAQAEGVSLNQLAVSALARTAARAAEGEPPSAPEAVSPYEAIDRLDRLERALHLLRERFEDVTQQELPELVKVVQELEDELAEDRSGVGQFLTGVGKSLSAGID